MERRIDDYRVIRQLGRGVMGQVLEAVDLETGKEVALQTLAPITPLPERMMREIKSRFVQETRLLCRLGHPHIVPITLPEEMAHRSTDPLYYVMPYIPGNLSQILGESGGATPITLSLAQALRVILPILDALDAVHQRGIIHRDIKPVNVLFRGDHIYLTNFSLPRPWEGEPPRRIESWPPTFQAPEVITRQQTIDGRADIYSVGALLYRMLTGRIPRCPTGSPRRHNPHIDRKLEALLLQALAPNPSRRFGRIDELRDALLEAYHGPLPAVIGETPEPEEDDIFSLPEIRRVKETIDLRPTELTEEELEDQIRFLLHKAMIALKRGTCNEAIRLCKIAHDADPEDQHGYHAQLHGVVAEAVKALKEQTRPLFQQALRSYNEGDLFKATLLFRKVLAIFPQHKEARSHLEKCLRLVDPEGAEG